MVEIETPTSSQLPSIPNNWEVKQLRDLISLISGMHLNPDEYNRSEAGLPYFTGPTDYTNEKTQVTKWTTKSSAIARKGDILLTVKGSGVGSLHQLELADAAIGRQIMALRAKPDAFNQFIYYGVCTKEYTLKELAKGNMIPGLTRSDILSLAMLVPPYAEQKAIARVLDLLDTVINQNNQFIAQKRLRKKWLMENLLTGRKRLRGFSNNWNEVPLSKLFERVTRKNSEVNTNVVTISAQRGFVRQTDFFNKSIASETLDNYFLVQRGEFCYNKSYSNGYPWGATKRLNQFDKAVVTTLYICFRVQDAEQSNGDFFEQFFEANLLDKGLMRIAHEGGRAHGLLNVTPGDFFSLKVIVPDYAEQSAIAKVLQTADREIQLLKTKTEKLREQKKGMMQQLLTGKKRLKFDDENYG